jgi:hypothetical protein
MPFAAVFREHNPHIDYLLGCVDTLAGVMTNGLARRHAGVADILATANEKGEVAVSALFTGTKTLIGGYRARFQPLAASLRAQLDAIRAAWNTYGDTGFWRPPPRVEPPAAAFTARVRIDDPRPLGTGERISAEYTQKAIDGIVDLAEGIATNGRDFFGDVASAEFPPGGELINLIDDTNIDHLKVFATMHTALKRALRDYVATVRTSCQTYYDTGHWANANLTLVPRACTTTRSKVR